jgi:hypothetical protein
MFIGTPRSKNNPPDQVRQIVLLEVAGKRAGLGRLRHFDRTDREIDRANQARRLEDHVDRIDISEVDSVIDELIQW